MDVVRVLDLQHYDCRRQRFRDLVHRNSSLAPSAPPTPDGKGGFSVVGVPCVRQRAVSVCAHVKEYYTGVAGAPCGLWCFGTTDFEPPTPNPQKIKAPALIQKDSDTGDKCHYNLHKVSDNRLGKAYRRAEASGMLKLCFEEAVEGFTHERAVAAKRSRTREL